MNPTALPVAEFLPAVPGSAPAGPGGVPPELVDPRFATDPAADPRIAADFAALLQSAGQAVEALPTEEPADAQGEAAPESAPAAAAPGSALDGLLFLAAVQVPVPLVPGRSAAPTAPQSAGSAAEPAGTPLAPRGPAAVVAALEAAVPGPAALAAESTPADPSLPHPAIVAPPGGVSPRSFDAIARDALPAAATLSRSGLRADPKTEAAISPVLPPTTDAAKRAAPDTVVSESRLAVAPSAVEPAPSLAPTATAATPAPVAVAVAVKIDTPVHDPAWRLETAGRIASLVTRGIEHAELRITPPELGPVEMRIDVRGGEATLAIVAIQPATRDALEQALPLLRDMLAQQGLSLGQATVHDGRGEQPATGGREPAAAGAFRDEGSESAEASALAPRAGLVRRLIDVFA